MKRKFFIIVFIFAAITLDVSGSDLFYKNPTKFLKSDTLPLFSKAEAASNNLSNEAPSELQEYNLEVTDAYAYESTPVSKNGVVFLKIYNASDTSRKLIAVEADVSVHAELHTHIMDGDVMMMREVEGYDIPAGEEIILQPKGHHIMLMGLNAPLQAGDAFPLTLIFEDGGRFDIMVTVKPLDLP